MNEDTSFVVAGEALFDLWLETDGAVRGLAGGGPYNTARALARLGCRVSYLGALSQDGFGRELRHRLAADGVDVASVVASAAPSTLALADVDGRGAASYVFWRDATASASLGLADALAVLPMRVDVLHVGTLGLVFTPMADAIEAVAHKLAGRAVVMVDPNIRPAAIDDEPGFRARLDRLLASATVVKVSDEDMAWLIPGRSPEAAARALLDRGPRIVLLTRGAAGALVMTAAGEREVPAPQVAVADTIGAGDAFSGGFLAAWRPPPATVDDLDAAAAAATYGALVASMTCERAGASPPTLAEVQARQEQGRGASRGTRR